jgi:hypothetical protein
LDVNLLIVISIGFFTLLATFLTVYFNLLLKKREYKEQYYKIVINKRLASYNNVEKMLHMLRLHLKENELSYHAIFENEQIYRTFYNILGVTITNSFWLNHAMHQKLSALNTDLLKHFPDQIFSTNDYKAYASGFFIYFGEYTISLQDLLLKDLEDLHDIPAFFKNKVF